MSPEHEVPAYARGPLRAIRDGFVGNDNRAWSVLGDPTCLYAADCDDPAAVSRAAQQLRDVAEALTAAAGYLETAAGPAEVRERAAEEPAWGCD